ncbi:MAG TPA: hypothetical protein VFQ34_07635, partial [Nitrospiraceae bacterium]|nr:hypothetical protein [Nitrospiraceae bacterium]
ERYLRFALTELNYFSRSESEHAASLQACYDRDVDEAKQKTSSHILDAGKALGLHLRGFT